VWLVVAYLLWLLWETPVPQLVINFCQTTFANTAALFMRVVFVGNGQNVLGFFFSARGQNDTCALCFLWLLGVREDLSSVAPLGFAFAQAVLQLIKGDGGDVSSSERQL
jgi:hypothetical protein